MFNWGWVCGPQNILEEWESCLYNGLVVLNPCTILNIYSFNLAEISVCHCPLVKELTNFVLISISNGFPPCLEHCGSRIKSHFFPFFLFIINVFNFLQSVEFIFQYLFEIKNVTQLMPILLFYWCFCATNDLPGSFILLYSTLVHSSYTIF